MNRDKETIYAYLTEKLVPIVAENLKPQEQVTLDGELWAIADALCDENAPRNIAPGDSE